MENAFTELKFADGRVCAEIVEVATVDVGVRGRVLLIRFVMLPHATENLLGMNFIKTVGMVLNFDLGNWSLRSDPNSLRE